MNRRPVSEADLHAWLDDELPPARRLEVDAWLAEQPEAAARLRAYAEIDHGLHALYDGVLDEPVPERLRAAATAAAAAPPRRRAAGWARAAAAAGWLLLGGVAGWSGHTWIGPDGIGGVSELEVAHEALAAHVVYVPEVRHPVEVEAAQGAHLAAWLSKRMGHPIRPPALETLGFQLLGGRLLPDGSGQPAAQFMYQDATGHRLTLYVTRCDDVRETAFRFTSRDGLDAFYWADGVLNYALVGDIGREALSGAAHEVYRQLEL